MLSNRELSKSYSLQIPIEFRCLIGKVNFLTAITRYGKQKKLIFMEIKAILGDGWNEGYFGLKRVITIKLR